MDRQAGIRGLQLPPQVVDMHGDRVRVGLFVDTVKLLLQHGFRYDTPEPPHHLLEDRQFPAGQIDRRLGNREVSPDCVEPDISGVERYSQHPTRTAEESLDPGDQLGQREGLGQIIVGAGIEAADPVLDRVPGGQNQDPQRLAEPPCSCQDRETIAIR